MEIEKKDCFVEDEVNVILDGLNSFNYTKVDRDYKPFMVVVKENDLIIAGAQCASAWDWMHVKLLWVQEDHGQKGLGTRLMSEIETEAKQRGCVGIHLDTFEFQALTFYQKLGYQIFGEIDDHPKGYKRFYLKKYIS